MTSDAEPLSDADRVTPFDILAAQEDGEDLWRIMSTGALTKAAFDIVAREVNGMCEGFDSDHALALDLIGDARYHRSRVRELEAERDDLRDVLRVVGECGDGCGHCRAIAEHHAGLRATVEGLIGERDDLRRQVAVARTALDALVREAGAGNQAARAIAIYREAIAALAPQTGEVGK